MYINNICFLKHFSALGKFFKKHVLLIYIVHLLGKYDKILQNAWVNTSRL